jgi:hypothetical protein
MLLVLLAEPLTSVFRMLGLEDVNTAILLARDNIRATNHPGFHNILTLLLCIHTIIKVIACDSS